LARASFDCQTAVNEFLGIGFYADIVVGFGAQSLCRVSTPPGKSSWIFFLKIPGPGKSWKITLVLESPEKNILASHAVS